MRLDLPPAWQKRVSSDAGKPRLSQAAPSAGMKPPPGGRTACACGGQCPRCRAADTGGQPAPADVGQAKAGENPLLVVGAVAPPSEQTGTEAPAMEETGLPGFDGESEGNEDIVPLGGNSACPVNAVFSSNVAGAGKANCQVPDGLFGAARLAQYIVRGVSPIPSGGLSIGERFLALEDPYSAFGLLKTVTATTDASGKFDDCYILASKSALPPDFVLKVAQYHVYNGQDISRNVITYTPGNVGVRHCRRKPDSCDFSDVCRL